MGCRLGNGTAAAAEPWEHPWLVGRGGSQPLEGLDGGLGAVAAAPPWCCALQAGLGLWAASHWAVTASKQEALLRGSWSP